MMDIRHKINELYRIPELTPHERNIIVNSINVLVYAELTDKQIEYIDVIWNKYFERLL